jgi:hypothetical protein
MDFIEQWFGLSPDGGDGSLEVLWIVAMVVAVMAIVFRRQIAVRLTSWRAGRR